jgi:methylenetetrahydrofolate--tRNA-(uracil-5-)-methyltransferase
VVQLRQDNIAGSLYNIVGFQTNLKFPEQDRVLRMIPGLQTAEFVRYGQMHRNTFINAPLIVNRFSQSKKDDRVYFAGQISGVEGYVESVASGLVCGLFAARDACGLERPELPEATAVGSLLAAISGAGWRDFRPSKFTFGLLPECGEDGRDKKRKKEIRAARALEAMEQWIRKAAL